MCGARPGSAPGRMVLKRYSPLASVASYKAGANPADELPPKPLFGGIDGMVPDARVPFGKALEVFPVPGK